MRPVRARKNVEQSTLTRLDELIASRNLPVDAAQALRSRHHERLGLFEHHQPEAARDAFQVENLLIEAEREWIIRLMYDGELSDEAKRRLEPRSKCQQSTERRR